MGYTTRKSLLEEIRSGNNISWFEFEQTYRPLILLRGQDYKLSDLEKEELCQQVLLDVFKGSSNFQYNPEKGRFRDYLRQLISHNAIDIIRRRKPSECPVFTETEDLSLESQWDQEWTQHILSQALFKLRAEMKPSLYQAFHLYAIEGKTAGEVAHFLGIRKSTVYVIKSRAVARLKQIISKIQDA
ncbi:sigma-70 family RNA polymerase sigma factor [Victivallaceae bacterium BBE-744-WT-12]|uniref:Sigma-70 family RNA polymerase sigma factor n=1 Tax=Victivallis lenta TaxID=2606640 RepID=A0A844G037_9BACT|nr:sigma-70 family RNA polymerase sigma factor [Victivallis lenta]MST96322.1 sigma-70 family RNA polymerase sigma factor [Victivallis lenta]